MRPKHSNVLSRWESVRRERALWIRPFNDLTIERALAYLEDLRKLCEDAGHILNNRIGNESKYIRCAGPGCGISLDGLKPNGMPKYVSRHDYRDRKNPEIIRSAFFCSELCWNAYMRSHGPNAGAHGNLGPNAKTV